jgi:hypothetical protein
VVDEPVVVADMMHDLTGEQLPDHVDGLVEQVKPWQWSEIQTPDIA